MERLWRYLILLSLLFKLIHAEHSLMMDQPESHLRHHHRELETFENPDYSGFKIPSTNSFYEQDHLLEQHLDNLDDHSQTTHQTESEVKEMIEHYPIEESNRNHQEETFGTKHESKIHKPSYYASQHQKQEHFSEHYGLEKKDDHIINHHEHGDFSSPHNLEEIKQYHSTEHHQHGDSGHHGFDEPHFKRQHYQENHFSDHHGLVEMKLNSHGTKHSEQHNDHLVHHELSGENNQYHGRKYKKFDYLSKHHSSREMEPSHHEEHEPSHHEEHELNSHYKNHDNEFEHLFMPQIKCDFPHSDCGFTNDHYKDSQFLYGYNEYFKSPTWFIESRPRESGWGRLMSPYYHLGESNFVDEHRGLHCCMMIDFSFDSQGTEHLTVSLQEMRGTRQIMNYMHSRHGEKDHFRLKKYVHFVVHEPRVRFFVQLQFDSRDSLYSMWNHYALTAFHLFPSACPQQ